MSVALTSSTATKAVAAVNGYHTNGNATSNDPSIERVQIIDDEKRFTYVSKDEHVLTAYFLTPCAIAQN